MISEGSVDLVRYEEMGRASWRKFNPSAGGHMAAVSVGRNGGLLLMNRRPSISEVYCGPPAGVYWVDIGVHHESHRLDLPAAEGVFTFMVNAYLSWRIGDPVQAVRDRVVSGGDIYGPFLTQEFRRLGREFGIDRFAEAEEFINSHFADRTIELPCGVTLLSCTVKLAPEESTQKFIKEFTFDRRETQRREAEQRARVHIAELEQKGNDAEQDLALQLARHRNEISELVQSHNLELEHQRMSFYSDALREGEFGVLALRLSSNRSDVNDVIKLIMSQRNLDFETARGMLSALLEQRLVNKRDVRDIMARATRVITDYGNPVSLAEVPDRVELSELSKSSMKGNDSMGENDDEDEDEDP